MDKPESLQTLGRTLDAATLGAGAAPKLSDLYDELRQLAGQRLRALPPGNTLQPTALVHEVWLRLDRKAEDIESKRFFFAAAARAMRDILVEQARAKGRQKRGGDLERVHATLEIPAPDEGLSADEMLGLHEALDRLEAQDARKSEVVLLRFFGGLQQREIATLLDVTERTVDRDWRYARAWLRAEMENEPDA